MLDGLIEIVARDGARGLRLACPGCGVSLQRAGDGCGCGMRLEIEGGLPHIVDTRRGRAADSEEGLGPILDLMAGKPWRDALGSSARHREVLDELTGRIGEDVLYGLAWSRIERVLVVGAGWGRLAFAIAAHGPEVVALEPSRNRARFMQMRAAQEGARVQAVVGRTASLPFEPGSFDLIALAVDPAEIGGGEVNAAETLAGLLASGRRLLRRSGCLYLASRSRFGLSAWLGRRDSSGVRFASVLPRPLARLHAGMLGRRHAAALSPKDIRRALLNAGFATVEVQGIVGQRSEQRGVYDATDGDARRLVRSCLTRPISAAGRLKSRIAGSRLLGAPLEDHVAVVAGVDGDTGRRLWSDVGDGQPAGQIDTYSKVMLLCRHGEGAQSILETAKTRAVARRLATGYEVLEQAEGKVGAQNALADLRWVKPLGRLRREGRDWYRYELAAGSTLTGLALSRREHVRVATLFERALLGYLAMCGRLASAAAGKAPQRPHEALLPTLRATWWDPGLVPRVEEALAFAKRGGWVSAPLQGDLSGDNLVHTADGRLCLIDWETVEPSGYPVVDLVRLYYDLAMEILDAGLPWSRRMIEELRAVLLRVLAGQGFGAADVEPLETLYFGHQAAMLGEKARAVGVSGMRLDRLERLLRDERVSIRFGG